MTEIDHELRQYRDDTPPTDEDREHAERMAWAAMCEAAVERHYERLMAAEELPASDGDELPF